MSRTVTEWRGRSPDTSVPPHVQLRVFLRFDGHCPKCTRKLVRGQWQCDHIVALINGGENRETNLQPLCTSPCHSRKTASDVAEKSRVYRRAANHAGIKFRKGRPMPGSRDSDVKMKIGGGWEYR
jgi:5-methylcytosine-specific restriction endonuclease McrA